MNTARMILGDLQRQPQDGEHHDDGAERVLGRVVLEGGEFLVLDRDGAGEPQACVILRIEMQVGGRLPDRVGRLLARLERAVVEHRAHLDEAAQLVRGRRLLVHQLAPGEARRPSGQLVLDRLREHGQRTHHVVEGEFLLQDALQREGERLDQPAPRRVGHQHLHQRLRLRQRADRVGDLLGRQEQKSVTGEKRVLAQLLDGGEQSRIGRQFLRQSHAGRGRPLRGRGVDDRKNFLVVSLERVNKGKLSLAPGQLRRD